MVKIGIFILKVLSRLPRFILVFFSYLIYGVLRIIGYRRKVIEQNLQIAFPEKSEKERKKIKREFYRIFGDYFIEFIMLFSVNKDKLVGKAIFSENVELLNKIKSENRPAFALAGHIFNWEWVSLLVDFYPQENMYGVFKPQKNKDLDKALEDLRFSLGGKGIATKKFSNYVLNHPNNADSLYYLIVDQSPKQGKKIKEFTTFFGRKTAVFAGFEILIRKTKGGVVYVEAEKLGLGKYIYHFKELTPKGEQFEKGEIIELFYKELEESIRQRPANWLWSHKRWKIQDSK